MKEYGPWKIKSSKKIYKNPWISVREDKVIQPDGTDGIHGLVKVQPGISIIAIDNQNYLYLIKEFRYALNKYELKAVSGGVEQKEKPKNSAKRELKEETGIISNKIIKLGKFDPMPEHINSHQFLFLAQDLEFSEIEPRKTENIEVKKVKLDEAIGMVMNSEITDGKTCTLILKIEKYLQNEK